MHENSTDLWSTEPALTEILADPIVHALMKADGFGRRDLCEILLQAVQSRQEQPTQGQPHSAAADCRS